MIILVKERKKERDDDEETQRRVEEAWEFLLRKVLKLPAKAARILN